MKDQKWDVYLGDNWIDRVVTKAKLAAWRVKRELTRINGYPNGISIRRAK